MDLQDKSGIIEEFMRDNSVAYPADQLSRFINYNDFGIPLAQALTYHLAIPTDEGERLIDETWGAFCDLLGIPAEEYYKDYDDCVRKARGL